MSLVRVIPEGITATVLAVLLPRSVHLTSQCVSVTLELLSMEETGRNRDIFLNDKLLLVIFIIYIY